MILSVLLSAAIYAALQLAFVGSIPTEMLTQGWQSISKEFTLPYRDISLLLGVAWLGYMVVADAIVSPAGAGNIYMNHAAHRLCLGKIRNIVQLLHAD